MPQPIAQPEPGSGSSYVAASQRRVLSALADALTQRRGLTVLTGPEGVGKTHVVAALRELLAADFLWRSPAGRPGCAADLRATVGAAGTTNGCGPAVDPAALQMWLRQRAAADNWTVLAIDDADQLDAEVLGEIDHLAGLEPMLQILLVGCGPEFLGRTDIPGGLSLEPRVRVRLQMGALPPEDWEGLLEWWAANGPLTHRLPFDHDAVGAVGSLARGLPGRMFEVAAQATEIARQQWVHVVTAEHVQIAGNAAGMHVLPASTLPAPDEAARLAVPASTRQEARSPLQPAPVVPDETASRAPRAAAGRSGLRPASARREPAGANADPFRGSPPDPTIDSPELLPVLCKPHSIETEWFRVLHARLEDWIRAAGGGAKTILVTGANINAGKTLVAANLSLLWAHNSWQRVLLIDGDLRRPQFHALFEIPRRPGLADVLAGRCALDEASAFISETGLHVLPAGRPGNPRELVNPDRVAKVFAAARESFDVVIVDSPPLSAMVDSRSMAAAADGVVMVVRSGATRLGALQRTLDYLPADNLIGAVVNASGRDAHNAYAEYRKSVQRG